VKPVALSSIRARVAVDGLAELAGRDQALGVGAGERALELGVVGGCEIEQRAGGRGDREAVDAADVSGLKRRAAVRDQAGARANLPPDNRDVHVGIGKRWRCDAPEECRRGVAENGVTAAGQECRRLEGEWCERLMADEVDAAKGPVKRAALRAPSDCTVPKPS
jgi:hypothetical protein